MDRERLWWSVNGERGQMPTFKASSHDYKRTDDLPDVDIEPINQILAQRLQARTSRSTCIVSTDGGRTLCRAFAAAIVDEKKSKTIQITNSFNTSRNNYF